MYKLLGLVILPVLLLGAAGDSGADQSFTVTRDSVLFSSPGSLVRIVEPGSTGKTYFAFEYLDRIQIYAERVDGSQTWELLDGRQYLCQALTMEIGNVWRFLDDETTGERRTAEVVSTGNVVVGAGAFQAWRVDIELDSQPGVAQESFWFAAGVGIVKQADWSGGSAVRRRELQTYSVTGLGYFPLVVDNTWQYADLTVPGTVGSLGSLKTRYRR